MEKPLAQAAGLGWQGKHTNLLSRELGNWFFLGAIFTELELPRDAAGADHCGSCRACLDVCPTGALPAPYRLDARRCISYLTIEHDGPVAEELRPLMGNRIYGCDDCLAVCPWNKYAAVAREAGYHARAGLEAPRLADLAALDDAGFRAMMSGSPIKRIGRNRFVRNVAYAIGNSGSPGFCRWRGGWRGTRTRWWPMRAPGPSCGSVEALQVGAGEGGEARVGVSGDELEPDLRGAGGVAGLGQGGAGLEERLGKVGVERLGALGFGEGPVRVVLVAQRGGEERVGESVVRALGERGLERGLGGGPVGFGGRGAGGEDRRSAPGTVILSASASAARARSGRPASSHWRAPSTRMTARRPAEMARLGLAARLVRSRAAVPCAPRAARAAASQSRAGTPPPMRCQTAAASRAAAGSAAMAALHSSGVRISAAARQRGGRRRGAR